MTLVLRIASYNVLSSSLSASAYFVHSAEKNCAPKHRLEKLFAKLEEEIAKEAVVCLQEVSLAWTGRLHSFFASKNYTFVNSNYGNRNNNFMGVGVAFPSSRYALKMADLSVISDTKSGGWNAPKVPAPAPSGTATTTTTATSQQQQQVSTAGISSFADTLSQWFQKTFAPLGQQLPSCAPASRAPVDPETEEALESWNLSKSRFNVMVSLRLRPVEDGDDDSREILISTYHVPCVFWNPGAMTICCALAMQKVQSAFYILMFLLKNIE